MLTPRELLQTDFRVTLRGYQQKEVDAFVRKAVQAYESLMRQNKELTERLKQLEQDLGESQRDGARSTELLKAAQENAVEIQGKAEQRARQIIEKAEAEAEEIVQSARQLERAAVDRVERIRQEEAEVRAALRTLLEEALHRLERSEAEQGPSHDMGSLREVAAADDGPNEPLDVLDGAGSDDLQG